MLYFDGVYDLKKREVGDDTREIRGGDGVGGILRNMGLILKARRNHD